MEDTFRHKGLRRQMTRELALSGITDSEILNAMMEVPRHLFLDPAFVQQAYSNVAFRIGAGQTISQPYTVAFQTGLLGRIRGKKMLEIGTGSGYQTSILCELGAKVFSVERQKELFVVSSQILARLGYTPKLRFGDGYEGWSAFAPFDCILVTCGAPTIPENLVEQLAPGGRLVVPVGEGTEQTMLRIRKSELGETSCENHGTFRFVPMLEERAN